MQGIVIISSLLLVVLSADGSEVNPTKNVTLIVAGRSGSGISSTVREIIGRNQNITFATGPPTPIKEIRVPIPGHQASFLKVVDVDGLVDGKSIEHDARVMAYLQSYLSDPTGLNGTSPEFFLIISNFDDTRLQGPYSIFMEMLKRVGMVQQAVYNDTTPNTIFLLTKFMTSTKAIQRRPQAKIQGFNETIIEFSPFKEPITLVVGENLRDEHELKVENGYTKLPNRQLYPKNVFDELINVAIRLGDNETADFVQKLRDAREDSEVVEVDAEYFQVRDPSITFERDEAQFLNTLYGLTSDPTSSEINNAIQNATDQLGEVSKVQVALAVRDLQRYFQTQNLTEISQLPTTSLERVRFFQNLTEINSFKLLILKTAFGLSMPNYFGNPVVGYGFDVIQDYPLEASPFVRSDFIESPIGYRVPDYLTCSKILETEETDFSYFSETLADYISSRYKFLGLEKSEGPTVSAFSGVGRVKTGFNLKPESETDMSLSAVREVRTIKCELNNVHNFTEEFREDLKGLSPFDPSKKDSIRTWRAFFGKFGTHVVTQGFGGGYIQSSVMGHGLREIVSSNVPLNQTLGEVLSFRNISVGQKPTYAFFGGDRNSMLENVSDLEPSIRETVLQKWRDSLNYDPIMLNYKLSLTPLATYVKEVDQNLGLEVERAASLFLSGNFIYKKKVRQPRLNSTSLVRPTSTILPVVEQPITTMRTNFPGPPPTIPLVDEQPTTIMRNNSPTPPPTQTVTFKPTGNPSNAIEKIVDSSSISPIVENSSQVIVKGDEITSTEKSKKVQGTDTDYTANVLGHSYHMLKEMTIPLSPFYPKTLKKLEQGIPAPCTLLHAKSFKNMQAYLEYRLLDTFGVTRVPRNVVQNFKGTVFPGSIIEDRIEGNEIDVEIRDYKEWINVEHAEISTDFKTSLEALPVFNRYSRLNCDGRNKWKEFFDRFGTHYVKSTYYGHANPFPQNTAELRSWTGLSDKCEIAPATTAWYTPICDLAKKHVTSRLADSGWCPSNLSVDAKQSQKPGTLKLRSSYEFVSYRDLMENILGEEWYLSMNEAMYHLMDNDLAC